MSNVIQPKNRRRCLALLTALPVYGCRPLVGGEAPVGYEGTLQVNDRGCVVLIADGMTFPFVVPDSDGTAPVDGVITLPDGQRAIIGNKISTAGVVRSFGDLRNGAAIAEQCGYEPGAEVAVPIRAS